MPRYLLRVRSAPLVSATRASPCPARRVRQACTKMKARNTTFPAGTARLAPNIMTHSLPAQHATGPTRTNTARWQTPLACTAHGASSSRVSRPCANLAIWVNFKLTMTRPLRSASIAVLVRHLSQPRRAARGAVLAHTKTRTVRGQASSVSIVPWGKTR